MTIFTRIITTADGTRTSTMVWDGAPDTTPGMIHGTTAVGTDPGITADGLIPGSMVTAGITDGTIPGITAVGTVPGTPDLAVTMAVTMAVVIPTGSTTAITAVLPKTVQAEVQVFTEEVQPTEHPPPWQVCPAGLRV